MHLPIHSRDSFLRMAAAVMLLLVGSGRDAMAQPALDGPALDGPELGGPGRNEAPDAEIPDAPPPKVDLAKREVLIPCRFVNPSRQIEVFACHTRGPTHETLFEFDTSGDDIYKALLQIGCRPTDYWNATSPSDFARTQGDRLIALVRWTQNGKTVEFPAEALLYDGDSAFTSFVRGFSFSAYDVLARAKVEAAARKRQAEENGTPVPAEELDPENLKTPVVVEVSLGASRRERAVYSVLSHPTSLTGRPTVQGAASTRMFQYWSLPPVVSDRTLPNLETLVKAGTRASLVLKRFSSEVEFIKYVRSTVDSYGEKGRLPLYDRIEPLAKQIDELKEQYENEVAQIRELLSEDRTRFFGESFREIESRGEMFRRHGQWICARVQELYFEIYSIEEAFKAKAVSANSKVHEEVRHMVETLYRDGLSYEARIASIERQREEGNLRQLISTQEIWGLELERETSLFESKRKGLRARLAKLGADENYVKRLISEDIRRMDLVLKVMVWRKLLNSCLLAEVRHQLGERASPAAAKIPSLVKAARQGLIVGKLSDELVATDESLRWYQNDLESGIDDRAKNAKTKIAELDAQKEKVVEALKEAREKLATLSSEAGLPQ